MNTIYLKFASTLAIFATLNVLAPTAWGNEPPWDANKVVLETRKLASGVYAVIPSDAGNAKAGMPIATTSGIIVGSTGVLVIDSMLNKRLAMQLMNHVKKITNKPVRYLVNTSFHGDHSYGNQYFPASTIIIQHQHTKSYIDQHFVKDTEFMLGAFGKGRGIEEAKPRTGNILIPKGSSIRLDLGDRSVEIKDFGFAQTGGDLMVWDEQNKIIWTGNAVLAEFPGIPWLLDGHLQDTLDTLRLVHEFLPADARVIPGHGSLTDRAAIKSHVDYLTELKARVQTSLKAGNTLEQTVQAADMKEYQKYALYGWVHNMVNVPAAFKELGGK